MEATKEKRLDESTSFYKNVTMQTMPSSLARKNWWIPDKTDTLSSSLSYFDGTLLSGIDYSCP